MYDCMHHSKHEFLFDSESSVDDLVPTIGDNTDSYFSIGICTEQARDSLPPGPGTMFDEETYQIAY